MTPKTDRMMKPENYFARLLFAVILIYSFLVVNCFSQPSITWQRIYDNPNHGDNEGHSICESTTGTYFLVGYSPSSNPSATQIIKINDFGDTIWSKLYFDSIPASSCFSSGDGGVVIVGGDAGRSKIDENGNVVWSKFNKIFLFADQFDIIKTPDSGYIACGYVDIPAKGYIMKFDPTGNLQWEKFFTSGGNTVFYSITNAYSNGYVVSGYEYDGVFNIRGILIRIDDLGNEIWRRYPIPSLYSNSCNTIRKFKGGYVTIAGGDTSFVVKVDSNGNNPNVRTYPPPLGSNGFPGNGQRIELYDTGKILLYRNQGGNQGNYFTNIKILDSLFVMLIERNIINNNGFTHLPSVLVLNNKDIIFHGLLELNGSGNSDFYAVRTDSNLNYPPIGIKLINSQIPTETALLKNYPNPFNPVTSIKFQIAQKKRITLRIFNPLGQLAEELIDKDVNQGIYEVNWDASEYSSGIYYCVMYIENIMSNSLKLVLIK